MWLVYHHEDSLECGFTVGNGTKADCIKYCKDNPEYKYGYRYVPYDFYY